MGARLKRAALIVLTALIVFTIGAYLNPTPSRTFAEVYAPVDPSIVAALQRFRTTHPPRTINVSGRDWSYITMGSGEQTVIFLHGMTGAYDIWWRVLEPLSRNYRVIAVTYPAADELAQLADGVLAVLENEEVQEAHFVGTSLGGYLTQYLMARNPERFLSAVLANTFPPNDRIARDNRVLGRLLPYLPEWAIMNALRANTEQKIYPAAGYSEPVRAYVLEQAYGRMQKDQFVGRYHCVVDSFTAPPSNEIEFPLLIIEADNDPLVSVELRTQLKEVYPTAAVVTLHERGHFPYLNAPEEYAANLLEFWSAL